MFLSALAKTSNDLGYFQDSKDYSLTLDSILSVASITNTMMWIGQMENCPLALSRQGQLLKQGNFIVDSGIRRTGRRLTMRLSSHKFCLILFQKSLVLCRTSQNPNKPESPFLRYCMHFRYVDNYDFNLRKIFFSLNQLRIRTVSVNPSTFEIQRMELTAVGITEAEEEPGTRIECVSEEDKLEWVTAINAEVDDLVIFAQRLSREFSSSEASLITI